MERKDDVPYLLPCRWIVLRMHGVHACEFRYPRRRTHFERVVRAEPNLVEGVSLDRLVIQSAKSELSDSMKSHNRERLRRLRSGAYNPHGRAIPIRIRFVKPEDKADAALIGDDMR